MSATCYATDRKTKTVQLHFNFDAATEDLAGLYLGWLPQIEELQAIERSFRTFFPGLTCDWENRLSLYWQAAAKNRNANPLREPVFQGRYLTTSIESARCLGGVRQIPYVTVALSDNPRAFSCRWAVWTVGWSMNVYDFLAIMLTAGRCAGIQVTVPNDLLLELEERYFPASPLPHRR